MYVYPPGMNMPLHMSTDHLWLDVIPLLYMQVNMDIFTCFCLSGAGGNAINLINW